MSWWAALDEGTNLKLWCSFGSLMRYVTLKRLTQQKNGNLFGNFLFFTPELAFSAHCKADCARQSQDWVIRAWATINLTRQLIQADMKKPDRESLTMFWFGIFFFFYFHWSHFRKKGSTHQFSSFLSAVYHPIARDLGTSLPSAALDPQSGLWGANLGQRKTMLFHIGTLKYVADSPHLHFTL